MQNLDDRLAITRTPNGEVVMTSINSFPDQLRQAWKEASSLNFPEDYKRVRNIVVCGMGGSRFGPLIVKELFKHEISVPYFINDTYDLPGFVGASTLVILSSYSGTTEEVLVCAEVAKKKQAKICGLCLGGPLASFFKSNNLPAYIFQTPYNPSNQPRIGVGYMVAGHIGLLFGSGYLLIDPSEIDEAIKNLPGLLKHYTFEEETKANPAKQMALTLYDKYPYYVTAEHLRGVGNAIANQTNETAKSISSFRYIPELNHHLMEGLSFPQAHKSMAIFVFFTSNLYDPRIKVRFEVTKDVVEQNGIQTLTLELAGKTRLEQALELVGYGSFMTMYLAILYKQDPSAIPWVDYFKKRLQELSA